MSALVAKQPILDLNEKVFAYELLFRGGDPEKFNGEKATAQVIVNSLESIGINNLTHGKPVFINFTGQLLKQGVPELLAPENLYIEVLEDVKVDEELIYSLTTYQEMGFKIALDDFVFKEKLIPLIKIADLIKIDFLITKDEERKNLVNKCLEYNSELKFLGEKIENYQEYEMAKSIGCEYFQGYYFIKPQIIEGKEQNSYKFTFFRIIEELNKKNPQFKKIEEIIKNDFSMAYSLLRIINSAQYGYEVKSLRQAIVLLGIDRLRKWTFLYFLKGLDEKKPDILFETAAFRAHFAEGLSEYFSVDPNENLFVLGLFSVIEAYLDRDMKDILSEISLQDEYKDALILRKGKLGDLLNLIENLEQFNLKDLDIYLEKYSLTLEVITEKYIKALEESKILINKFEQ